MLRTLIVEDHAPYRRTLHHVLARRFPFMEINEAASGEDALAQAAVSQPDLVFMDLRLPGKNGLDTTRELKAQHSHAGVCVITSFDVPEYREAARRCGADQFLIKGEAGEAQIIEAVHALFASHLRCLIIEDSAPVREALVRMLVAHWPGMLVVEAADGAGLQDAAALQPQLVLLDLRLPGASGLELAANIKAQCPQAVLVVVSSNDLPEYRQAALSAGAAHFIAKAELADEALAGVIEAALPPHAAQP